MRRGNRRLSACRASSHKAHRRVNATRVQCPTREGIYKDAFVTAVGRLLPVLDNLDRAAMQPCQDAEYLKGVGMIARQFYDILEKDGIKLVREERIITEDAFFFTDSGSLILEIPLGEKSVIPVEKPELQPDESS